MKKNIYKLFSSAKKGLFAFALTAFWGLTFSQTTYTFVYTGASQTLSLPAGSYSIACWGADGGTVAANTATQGMGGYSKGNIILTAPTVFTIYVGGKGNGGAQPLGGFNSGNSTTKTNTATATGGGGASDVRVLVDDYNHRIIVAGGGGGQGTGTGIGGHGGGLTGQNGQGTTNAGNGGTQSAPGLYTPGGDAKPATFGEGGDGPAGTTGGQGGGGWYGGSFGTRTNGGGAGGSGYVLTSTSFSPVGYFAANSSYYFTNDLTTMPATAGFVTNPDLNGNGRVLITELCAMTLVSSGSNSLNPTICSGQSLTLTTNAISNYSWSTGAVTSSLVVSPTSNTVYALTATAPASCTTTRSISITVSSAPPVLSISNPSTNICLGKTVSLTATGALSYTWTNPGVVNGQTFTPSATTVYTVTGSNGCGNTVATTTITVAPLAVTASASSTLVCQGYTTSLSASSAVSNYTWEPGTIPGSVAVVAPTVNTLYTVTATDGTCSGTQTVFVTTKVTPVITAATSATAICLGDQVTLSASGAGTGGTYSWTPGGAGSSINQAPTTSTVYFVEGTNTLGCSAQAQQLVVVNLPANLSVTAVANKTLICDGQSATLTASGASGYSWVGGPSTAGYTVTPTNALTVYTVNGTQSTNTCVATKTIAVAVITPSATLSSTVSVCDGLSAVLTASGATSYTWNGFSSPGGSYTTTPPATSTFTLLTLTTLGTVSCPKTYTALVIVNPNPTITVTPARPTICKGESNTFTATGASSYNWGTLGTGSVVVGSPTATIIYTITGTDANNCESTILYSAKVNNCLGISESKLDIGISVYPNPSSGEFVIRTEKDITVELSNELGQHLHSITLNAENRHEVKVNDLAPGIYFLTMDDGEVKLSQKVLIMK